MVPKLARLTNDVLYRNTIIHSVSIQHFLRVILQSTYSNYRGLQHDAHAATALLRPHPATRDEAPATVLEDIVQMKGRISACHGGFYTPPHRHSNGMCTTVTITSGLRIWGFLVPIKGPMTMQQRKAWDENMFVKDNRPMFGTRRCVVFLPPGSTLCVLSYSSVLVQLIYTGKISVSCPLA